MRNWIFKINNHGKKIYSQSLQDGIIEFIFNNLQTQNKPPFCVEFGFNSDTLTGGSGPNVAHLIKNKGWKCLLLDGDYKNPDINLYKHVLTSDNICDIFKKYNVPKEPEYVSIDVDSTDLWLFKAVLSEYNPMVVSVEYNAHFPLDRAITFIDNAELGRSNRIYGASLKALKMVGEEFGYSLVCLVTGLDAYFIRNDLINGLEIPDFDTYAYYQSGRGTSINWHPPQTNNLDLVHNFLDYEVFLETNGDIEKSKVAALAVCDKYLFNTIK